MDYECIAHLSNSRYQVEALVVSVELRVESKGEQLVYLVAAVAHDEHSELLYLQSRSKHRDAKDICRRPCMHNLDRDICFPLSFIGNGKRPERSHTSAQHRRDDKTEAVVANLYFSEILSYYFRAQ